MNEEKYLIIDNKNRNRDITSNVASIRIGNSMTMLIMNGMMLVVL